MAAPSYTYTFINGTSADATEVNTNNTDWVNAMTDGTKDFTLNDLTINGNTTLGNAATDTLTVNARTALPKSVKLTSPGYTSNLGISLSAGVLSIVDSTGAAISSTNPGWVCVPSTTAGLYTTLQVTVGGAFNDDSHASSSLTNFGFGITEAADWAQDVPFFIYAVNRANSDIDGVDGSSVFCLARNPAMASTPTSPNNIGDFDSNPVTDDQTSILIMDQVTVANYTSLPCILIGALRMRWSTTTDDWTVQTLGAKDGIGPEQLQKIFATTWTYPTGQNGAASSTHVLANGGTAPLFSTTNYSYLISSDGSVFLQVAVSGDGGTDGVGAVSIQIAVPYASGWGYNNVSGGNFQVVNPTDGELVAIANIDNGLSYITLSVPQVSGTALQNNLDPVQNGDFTNGGRNILGNFRYKAF